MKTAELLRKRLELAYQWYRGMLDRRTGMFEYLYVPQTDTFIRKKSPIRDIASVWDAEMLDRFLNRHDLQPVAEKSLRHYGDYLVERDEYLILDPVRLEEPSSIAHSAFMILAMLNSPLPHDMQQINDLAEGILHQQRLDGSYKVYFDDLPDSGEELYAGEAMLALLEAYRELQDTRHLQSAELAFSFYDTQYFQRGRVVDDILVFFANWQSQACRLLFEFSQNPATRRDIPDYVCRMHDQIIGQEFYENIVCEPAQQTSVEVACALEGLIDAYAAVRTSDNKHAEAYHRCICIGLTYLIKLQCNRNGTARDRGGFGLSLENRTQRIDVTGHAANALMKSVENRIECQAPASKHRDS